MRLALIGFAIVVGALAADMPTGNAQYNSRWCTDGSGIGETGTLECSSKTLEQCLATAHGRGQHCVENPDYVSRASDSRDRQPPRKSRRQRDN